MIQLSVSLGTHALSGVREAIEHAVDFPTHDPVVYLAVYDEGDVGWDRGEEAQRVRWRCACQDPERWPYEVAEIARRDAGEDVPVLD